MLSYTAEVLQSVLAQYNAALWPGQVLVYALLLGALYLLANPNAWSSRAIAALLAASWLWVGVVYYLDRLAAIDFSAPLYGGGFLLQALLLLWLGLLGQRVSFAIRQTPAGYAGLAAVCAAVFLMPLLSLLTGPSLATVQMAGLTPLPTVFLTVGFLLLAAERIRLLLAVVPLLWALAHTATAWTLGLMLETALTALCLIGLGLLVWKRRNRAPRTA